MTHQLRKTSLIDDYGVIGDCRTAALVSRYGSIDWLCWPRFDCPAIFAAVLDRSGGGSWSITPAAMGKVERRYAGQSNVLETKFVCQAGEALLTDLMPVASEEDRRSTLFPDHEIIRHVRCTYGEVEVEVEFHPRADYGRLPVRLRPLGALGICMDVGRGSYCLRSDTPLSANGDRARGTIRLKRGETAQFSLTYAEEAPTALPVLGQRVEDAIQRSIRWWEQWAAASTYTGPYRDAVVRSALALKFLAFSPSGAITAAPTTSLPETAGGPLNWDYRFCWLRDASLTIRALLGLGYVPETESFLSWLLHTTRLTQPKLKILYTVYGQIAPAEKELAYLRGYLDSRPVRIGNDARNQVQLDIYGEVIDAAAQYARYSGRLDRTTQKVLLGLGSYVAQHWDQPDDGIWEPRSGPQNRTHSRLLCWTALDRLLRLGEAGIVSGVPAARFAQERDRVRRQIEERGWNPEVRSYVSTLDGDALDSSLLLIPAYGFESADSDRMRATYRAIREQLGTGDGLLYRYKATPAEGAFGVCGFWAAQYLALGGGTLQEAHEVFSKLLEYANDLGLYAEETDPDTGRALGNFPQAFTHVGLIGAALALEEREARDAQPVSGSGASINGERILR